MRAFSTISSCLRRAFSATIICARISASKRSPSFQPAFDKDKGTITAANSTPLTDGASAVLLASEEWAAEHGLKPMAYLTYGQHYGIDFVDAGRGLLMAPTIAVSKMLDQAGLTLQDFDFYEIHEAFAAQVLCTLKAWEDPEFCKTMLGKDKPLGLHRPLEAERERLKPRLWPSLRGDRSAYHRDAREDPRRERRRTRADIHLHGGRHGRVRHHGAASQR